jgi:hypothetical protein
MRYLSAAFWARPAIPLFRLLPWNALGVAAAAIAGYWDPAVWAIAGPAEMIYLMTMTSNPGFRRFVDMRRLTALDEDTAEARKVLRGQLGGSARQRYVRLEEKRSRLEKLVDPAASDDLMLESNRRALRKLTWLHLKLLVAQRNLVVWAPKADRKDLDKQIAALERELAYTPAGSLRDSKEATLRLTRERLHHLREREMSLVEIESDLSRIEAQMDVALDEATLRGRSAAISAAVEVTSHLLSRHDHLSSSRAAPAADTTTTANRETQ